MRKSQHTREYRRLIAALRAAREEAGLTQEEVAGRLRTYASFVSKCESGERRLDVVELAALCRLYGIDLLDFLRGRGSARRGKAVLPAVGIPGRSSVLRDGEGNR